MNSTRKIVGSCGSGDRPMMIMFIDGMVEYWERAQLKMEVCSYKKVIEIMLLRALLWADPHLHSIKHNSFTLHIMYFIFLFTANVELL